MGKNERQRLPTHRPAELSDLLVLGVSLIRRHDKGEMTDTTIAKYVEGVAYTYRLSGAQAQQLEEKLKESR